MMLGHHLVYVVIVTFLDAEADAPGQARSSFGAVSGRIHSETWAGCIVFLTIPTTSHFADFSRGCAHPATRPSVSATHPPLLDSRISSPEAFHPDACVAIARLRCLLVLRGSLLVQPQRDVG